MLLESVAFTIHFTKLPIFVSVSNHRMLFFTHIHSYNISKLLCHSLLFILSLHWNMFHVSLSKDLFIAILFHWDGISRRLIAKCQCHTHYKRKSFHTDDRNERGMSCDSIPANHRSSGNSFNVKGSVLRTQHVKAIGIYNPKSRRNRLQLWLGRHVYSTITKCLQYQYQQLFNCT